MSCGISDCFLQPWGLGAHSEFGGSSQFRPNLFSIQLALIAVADQVHLPVSQTVVGQFPISLSDSQNNGSGS